MVRSPRVDALGPATVSGEPGAQSGDRRRLLLGRIGVAALIALALFLLISGVSQNHTPTSALPRGLESVAPASLATNVPSQSTIVADLAFGDTGVLVVNGREIPLDQLDYERATGVLSFTPGKDREFEKLPGSDVRVVVIFWPEQGTREANAREYAWTFNVL